MKWFSRNTLREALALRNAMLKTPRLGWTPEPFLPREICGKWCFKAAPTARTIPGTAPVENVTKPKESL